MDKLNQLLHNTGFSKTERFELLKKIFRNYSKHKSYELEYYKNICHTELLINILEIIKDNNNDELLQEFFMKFGNVVLKKNLDQFYTPITISKFIANIIKKNKKIIEPACGTGDMTICLDGEIHLWDISKDACNLAELNYNIRDKSPTILNIDTLKQYEKNNNTYTYCITNPPFGTKTILSDKKILDKYDLGCGRKSQQLGILFIERAMNLLEDNGLLFIVLPSGYMGNSQEKYLREYLLEKYRIISLLQLPKNTFKRSGTGVETYMMIVQKIKMSNKKYNILIEKINNIGYVLNKKSTPNKYKVNKLTGKIVKNDLGQNIRENDFIELEKKIKQFAYDNNIMNLTHKNLDYKYEYINTIDLVNNNFDIKKYLKKYTDTLIKIKKEPHTTLGELCIKDNNSFKTKELSKKYRYIAISNIQTPLYKPKELYGWELPNRAKQIVKKYDILISRLEGNISITIILDDKTDDIVVTNGVCILHPKNKTNAIHIFSQLLTEEFKTQHQSLVVGSIMQSLTDINIQNIIIPKKYEKKKFNKIIKSLELLINLL